MSVDELGLSDAVIEALTLEGIETPTAVQIAAIPAVRRGKDVFIEAGSGAGVTWAWASGLIDRLANGNGDSAGGIALVVAATEERAGYLAENVARVAAARGLAIAATGGVWRNAAGANLLFATPDDIAELVSAPDGSAPGDDNAPGLSPSGSLTVLHSTPSGRGLNEISALVIDQLSRLEKQHGLEQVGRLLGALPGDTQRIVTAFPATSGVRDLCRAHLRKAPSITGWPAATEPPRGRGGLRYRVTLEDREEAALEVARSLMAEGVRHVIVFRKGDDALADFGDLAALRGFGAGGVGDADCSIWLARDVASTQEALSLSTPRIPPSHLAVLSCDLPHSPKELHARHELSPISAAVALPREVAHLKAVLKAAGYAGVPWPARARTPDRVDALLDPIRKTAGNEATTAYLAALQPLFEEMEPAEVAAAAVSLWRASANAATPYAATPQAETASSDQPEWEKLFLSCGRRDGAGPGDILGAITGEAKVAGTDVGKISIQESHTLVEIRREVAKTVVRALNGCSLKGRAVRVDFDRPRDTRTQNDRNVRSDRSSGRTRERAAPGGGPGRRPPERRDRPRKRP